MLKAKKLGLPVAELKDRRAAADRASDFIDNALAFM